MWTKIHWDHWPPTELMFRGAQRLYHQPGDQQVHRGSLEPSRPQPGPPKSVNPRTSKVKW